METKERNRTMNDLYESKLSAVQFVMRGAGALAAIGAIGVTAIALSQNAGERVGETAAIKASLVQTAAAAPQVAARTQEGPRDRVESANGRPRDLRPGGLCRDC